MTKIWTDQPLPTLQSMLNIVCPVKIVDVGANSLFSDPPPYTPLLNASIASVVGFEPNQRALTKLNEKKGAHETYLPHVIGDGKKHTLHYCQASGMTSLLEPNPQVLNLFLGFPDWGRVLGTEEVNTVRLDDIPETTMFDYLKIDIQGGELMVFQNATERLKNAVLIHTEVEFIPMYKNQPLFAEVDHFLRQQGFMLHRFDSMYSATLKPVNPYACLNQTLSADAIFIKDITRLQAMTSEQLLKLAVILHECYQSYDLTLYLLSEYDRRTGKNYAEPYQKILVSIESRLAFCHTARTLNRAIGSF